MDKCARHTFLFCLKTCRYDKKWEKEKDCPYNLENKIIKNEKEKKHKKDKKKKIKVYNSN